MHEAEGETTSGEADPIGERWQRAEPDFLRGLLALPELALVAESCPAERLLHERLVAEPTRAVGDDELEALADADARDNYATFLAFRDAVERAGTLEAHYLALVRGGRIALPPVFLDRMVDIGIISRESAIDWGITGPNLRASGVPRDLRKDNPYLGYGNYQFDIPIADEGDCYARYQVRMEEMRQSILICRQVLDTMPSGPVNLADSKSMLPAKERVLMSMEELIHHFIISTQGIDAPAGEVYFGAENPKGELGFYIHSKGGGVPYRLKIRSPSFCNLSIVSKLLPGHMVSDIPAILGSLDFVMGECDR